MIAGRLKSTEEILSSIENCSTVLVVACGGCVTVCLSGGDREARALVGDLSAPGRDAPSGRSFSVATVQRQCDADLMKAFLEIPAGTEAILSLACGAGVQTLAETFADLVVVPALDTTFLGALDEQGVWRERCRGCGECVLAYTAGICPIARCAKGLLNGPCGGSRGGKCEVGDDVECAWQLIVDRLKATGRLDRYGRIFAAKDWSCGGAGGPRSMRRTANSSDGGRG